MSSRRLLYRKINRAGDKIYMREPVENIDGSKAAVCEYAKNDPNILFVYIKERVDKEKPQVIGL